VDATAPSTVTDALSSYVGTATIAFVAVDNPGGSGVNATYYRLDGAAALESTSVVVPPPVSSATTHTLEYWSVDNAGNIEQIETATFTVAADTEATLAFRWEPTGLAKAQLSVLDSSGASIASTSLAGDTPGAVDWNVRVPIGQQYQVWCDSRELDDAGGNVVEKASAYGMWITPSVAGQTYTWWY